MFYDTVNVKMADVAPMVNNTNMSRVCRWNDAGNGKPQHKKTNLFQCHSVTNPIWNIHG